MTRLLGLFRHQDWHIGIADDADAGMVLDNRLPRVRWLPPPAEGGFLADPFPYFLDGQRIILAEYFRYGEPGTIVAISPDRPQQINHCDFGLPGIHLSYPYPVRHEGRLYCLPEAQATNKVALFAPTDFPCQWDQVAILVSDFPGVDPTLIRHGDRWWLFCTHGAESPNSQLHLWFAEDLFGPWHPHPRNPVKVDPGSARPAGPPFSVDGTMYRPAQDCSRAYGARIVINEILLLNEREFAERPAAVLSPIEPFNDGLHTLVIVDGMAIIDGNRFRFQWHAFRDIVARNIARLLNTSDPADKDIAVKAQRR